MQGSSGMNVCIPRVFKVVCVKGKDSHIEGACSYVEPCVNLTFEKQLQQQVFFEDCTLCSEQ